MSLLTIGHLRDKHVGEAIWIVGTGPSLNRLNDSDITGPRIYLNRVAFELPREKGKTYWFVADDAWGQKIPGPWQETLGDIRTGQSDMVAVLRNPLFGTPCVPPPQGKGVYLWRGTKDREHLKRDRNNVFRTNTLYMWSGTCSPAIHLAWLMGAAKVILVGIDGTDGHADRLKQYYGDKQTKGGFGYGPARADALLVARTLELEVEDRSEPEPE